MNRLINAGIVSETTAPGAIWFAKEPEQDLEFDEGLEDEDALRPKPPSRRPLIWILVLLVVVAGVYWILQPSSTPPPTQRPTPISEPSPSLTSPAPASTGKTAVVPSPRFHEGQRVVLTAKADGTHPSIDLKGDANGTTPGPSVKAGDVVTILDGAFVNGQWMYQVRTPAGATGWTPEETLQPKS